MVKGDLLLFDVDGTIVESGQKMDNIMKELLINVYQKGYTIGIVGGGKFDKILFQLDDLIDKIKIKYIFSECGSIYYKYDDLTNKYVLVYQNNIREYEEYKKINILVKTALHFLSQVDYIHSGHFIDLRNGLIYISLIGMDATYNERMYFMEMDRVHQYKSQLLNKLIQKAEELNIDTKVTICYGGSVGISIYPKIWDKVQVLNHIDNMIYDKIYYFGDKYEEDGNDYQIIHHKSIIGVKVDKVEDTIIYIKKHIL